MRVAGLSRTLAAACLTLALGSGTAPAADTGDFDPAVGNWLNVDTPGWGLDLQRIGDIIFVLWFTYREDGSPVWYLAAGALDPQTMSWTGSIDEFSWDAEAGEATAETVGSMTIVWTSPTRATFSWTLNGVAGDLPIRFLRFGDDTTPIDHTGHYFPPSQSGWGASVLTQGTVSAMFLYFYDADGEPVWALGNALQAGFDQVFPLVLFDGPGLCPSCLAARGDAQDPGTEALADVRFIAVRRPFLARDDVTFTDVERLAGVNFLAGSVNPASALGADPFSAIDLPAGVEGLGPFQTLEPLTPEHHGFSATQRDYLDRAQRLSYDPGIFGLPAGCIGSLVVNIDIEAPGPTGYPRSFAGDTPFTQFVPGRGESEPIAAAVSRAGDDSFVLSWMAYWPSAGITEGLMLVGRESGFFEDPTAGVDMAQVVTLRTVEPSAGKGEDVRNRVDLAADSGQLPLQCARLSNP